MTLTGAERTARSRLLALTLVRLAGILVMMLGLGVAGGDLLRPGGWPAVGIPLALAGFVGSMLMPKVLARRWRSAPKQ